MVEVVEVAVELLCLLARPDVVASSDMDIEKVAVTPSCGDRAVRNT